MIEEPQRTPLDVERGIGEWRMLGPFYDHWNAARGDKFAPSLDEFDLPGLALNIIPSIMILDIIPPKPIFRVRFWGTQLVNVYGLELTGQEIGPDHPNRFMVNCWSQSQELVISKTHNAFVLRLTMESLRTIDLAVLRLPLSSDGVVVDGIVTCDDFGDEKNAFVRYFEQN